MLPTWKPGLTIPSVPARNWLRFPLIFFLFLFVVEYSLDTHFSNSVHTQYENDEIKGENTSNNSTNVTIHEAQQQQLSHEKEKIIWKDAHRIRAVNSSQLWAEHHGLDICWFPNFFDPEKYHYNLNVVGGIDDDVWVEPGNQREIAKSVIKEEEVPPDPEDYLQMMVRKERNPKYDKLQATKNITCIHVGKAGGSSMGCNIAAARRYVRAHCSNMKYPVPLSAISLHVNCYTHWEGHMYCYDDNDAFLVNTRHPVQRMASWFHYEHVRNHPYTYPGRYYHCGDLMLYSCYETFDELISIGLGRPRPPNNNNQKLRVGANLTEEECSHWAWAGIQGTIPTTYHNWYNYDWYTHRLFPKSNTSEIFVLRAEHFEQDWTTIDQLLGGTGLFPKSMQSHQNSASKKPLPVFNNSASPQGIRNLCHALCDEIQIYKRLLRLADNLNPQDLAISMQELRDVCPDEADIKTEQCSYY